ncbi:MAG: DUF2608 domain-containing protein, partial [Bdellovibrionales bacterium]|nr:DUF2608 domain-containing protein [Bdellovibrionales bacterium]
FGSEALSTDELKEVVAKVKRLSDRHGAKNVLAVFDIDNTLLASQADLGSDQWFSWQEELLKKNPQHPDLVYSSFPELLNAWGALLVVGEMRMTEGSVKGASTASYVKAIQDMGAKVIALTSRGFDYEIPTLRAFEKYGIDLKNSAIGPIEGYPEISRAYQPDRVGMEFGFTEKEVLRFGLNKPSQYVTYKNGIFFTAGMHKGAMLRLLLTKTGYEPGAIVFVDDREKHTERVQEAFAPSDMYVVTFRYSREDARVEEFLESKERQQNSLKKWRRIRALMAQP